MAHAFERKILDRSAKLGVIGLGYVGLPLIRAFIRAGFRALGFDIDQTKVDRLRAGQSYIKHIPAEWIAATVADGTFEPTSDMRRLAEADAILICVPTPLNESRDPDLAYIVETAKQIAAALRPGQLIVLESTTYPGTTRDVVLPILAAGGMKVGTDYFLGFSPEREDPGNAKFSAESIPKVVGGIDLESGRLAALLYSQAIVQVVPVSNCEIAEAAKIVENTYRSVNIAMVNELKMLFDRIGIDIWEVIDAAKTKPFGFQAFYPGPGLGGHCIPIDPFYLSWLARRHGMNTKFIELAGEVNTSMPRYVIGRLMEALNKQGKPLKGSKVCVLGVSYKKDIDDNRESPTFELIELLLDGEAVVSYSDPFFPTLRKIRHHRHLPDMNHVELTAEYLQGLDCALIATDHSSFNYEFIVRHAPLVVDTRNATKHVVQGRGKICKA
ncbi:MAG: nucleotide sugar dehydrogenase [Pirellulales bacterium]|nr:nucleotide sugar dehydrogenase [Pirellulales bacterium]